MPGEERVMRSNEGAYTRQLDFVQLPGAGGCILKLIEKK